MLSTLNAAMDIAFSRAATTTRHRQQSPLDFLNAGSGIFDADRDYGAAEQEDQYAHYRGDFHSAARIIVHRFASQPLYAARLGVTSKSRSLATLMRKGFIPPNGAPEWIGLPDDVEVLAVHPILTAMSDPNPRLTRFNMWEIAIGSLLVTGRFFLVALRSETKDRALDIFAIPATWMTPVENYDKWVIKPPSESGDGITVDDEQVAHGYFADPQSMTGAISPLTMVGRAVINSEAIAASQTNEFKNGSTPKVALIAGDVMNETSFTDDPNRTSSARPVRLEPFQRRQIVTWFQQQFAGGNNIPLVLDAVIRDVKILSRKPNEMGYVESAGLTREQINEQLGVSNILKGQLGGATRVSGDLADQIFVNNCFNPIINLVSQVLTKKFGPLFSLDGERLAVWVAPALYQDTELDIELIRLMVRGYALTPNELRAIARKRFGGLPWEERFEAIVMPQTLDQRGEDADWMGVGRIAVNKPTPAPVVVPPAAAKPTADDDEKNGKSRYLLNGNHR